jgi:hypothetical protein
MNISDSAQLYLKNYFVLEQTRKDTHLYLEEIAKEFSSRVEEHINVVNHELFAFEKWVQNDGGRVIFEAKNRTNIAELDYLGDLKFSIYYTDAMRNNALSSPTHFIVGGYSPKASAKLIHEFQRAAERLELPDPYAETEGELLDKSFEEIVYHIAKLFIDRLDQIIQILESLITDPTP